MKEDKSPNAKEKKRQPSPYSQIREVCYPQGAIVELDIPHYHPFHSSSLTCTYDLIV